MEAKYMTAAPDRYDLLKTFAKNNRRESTLSETTLWNVLRKEIKSYKFRRQHPIGDYIADFFCTQLSLVIEVDGGYHETPEQKTADQWRTDFLEGKGYHVLRFTNDEVNAYTSQVISRIKEEIDRLEENS